MLPTFSPDRHTHISHIIRRSLNKGSSGDEARHLMDNLFSFAEVETSHDTARRLERIALKLGAQVALIVSYGRMPEGIDERQLRCALIC